MATVVVTGTDALSEPSARRRSEVVRAPLWRAFIVLVLVAIQASLAIVSWQWTLTQVVATPGTFGQGLAYLMMSAFVGQAFLFAFWLAWTPLPAWFRLPLVFAIVYCVSLAVFNVTVVYGALAVVLIATAFLEPLRLLTKWRCDYAPHCLASKTLPPFPKRLKLRDVGESVGTLAVLLGMAWWISGTGQGELRSEGWAYLVVLTFCGLLLCVPVTFLVFSPSSRGLWMAIGVGNGILLLLTLLMMAIFPISILYAVMVVGVFGMPQLVCAGTLLALKKLGWRFYSIADEVRSVRQRESRIDGTTGKPSRLWNASIIAALVVINGLFAVAMMRGMSEMDLVNGWITLLVQGPGIAILIGQLVLLGLWCTWTPMPSWLRFPLILAVGYAVDLLSLGITSSVGVLGALTVAALLEPMRMVTKWRCDYRPDLPESHALPPVTFKLTLWDIFDAILSWAIIFGAWRVVVTFVMPNAAGDSSGLIQAGLFLCLMPILSVPAGLLVFSPRSKWLWGIVIAAVSLHLAIAAVIAFFDPVSIEGIIVWSIYWFGSAGVCVGTLYVLKKLGWRFYSACENHVVASSSAAFSASLATG